MKQYKYDARAWVFENYTSNFLSIINNFPQLEAFPTGKVRSSGKYLEFRINSTSTQALSELKIAAKYDKYITLES